MYVQACKIFKTYWPLKEKPQIVDPRRAPHRDQQMAPGLREEAPGWDVLGARNSTLFRVFHITH